MPKPVNAALPMRRQGVQSWYSGLSSGEDGESGFWSSAREGWEGIFGWRVVEVRGELFGSMGCIVVVRRVFR